MLLFTSAQLVEELLVTLSKPPIRNGTDHNGFVRLPPRQTNGPTA